MFYTKKSLGKLVEIERDLKALVSASEEWGVSVEGELSVVQLKQLNVNNLRIITVVPYLSQNIHTIKLPETNSKVVSFSDFITLFDSIDDVSELNRFWEYTENQSDIVGPMVGLCDFLGAFRDGNEVLVDGAVSPNLIALDPHWGSNWRYSHLVDFWRKSTDSIPW